VRQWCAGGARIFGWCRWFIRKKERGKSSARGECAGPALGNRIAEGEPEMGTPRAAAHGVRAAACLIGMVAGRAGDADMVERAGTYGRAQSGALCAGKPSKPRTPHEVLARCQAPSRRVGHFVKSDLGRTPQFRAELGVLRAEV
jgi:hypothetical protein